MIKGDIEDPVELEASSDTLDTSCTVNCSIKGFQSGQKKFNKASAHNSS